MKRSAILAVVLLAFAAVAPAAPPNNMLDYTPITCVKAGEMPVLQLNVYEKGELRAFFRKVNTTDWCSVEGDNRGPLSRIVLPKFEAGDEIEYFIVLLDGKRVIGKSPQIYRVAVSDKCESPWARHIIMISMDCTNEGMGSIPSSMGAGFSLKSQVVTDEPPFGSPDRPQ
jgi:hypothetical protein